MSLEGLNHLTRPMLLFSPLLMACKCLPLCRACTSIQVIGGQDYFGSYTSMQGLQLSRQVLPDYDCTQTQATSPHMRRTKGWG